MAGTEQSENISQEDVELDDKETPSNDKTDRLIKLPLSRIKSIIKMDPEVALASTDAAILIAKATELFIQEIAKEAYVFTAQGKRKTVQKKDLDQAVDRADVFAFLEGTLDS